jgi:hypothetical protein
MESQLSTVQKESERWTVQSPHQSSNTTWKFKTTLLRTHKNKMEAPSLHDTPSLFIGCMEILFLRLAATIFGLD